MTCASTDCATEAFRQERWNYSIKSHPPHSQIMTHPCKDTDHCFSGHVLPFARGQTVISVAACFSSACFMFHSARFYLLPMINRPKRAFDGCWSASKVVWNQLMGLRLGLSHGAPLSELFVNVKVKAHLFWRDEQTAFESRSVFRASKHFWRCEWF